MVNDALANVDGLGSLTMRRFAAALGVEAMPLYHDLTNKHDGRDVMVDVVYGQIRATDHRRRLGDGDAEAARRPVGTTRLATTPGNSGAHPVGQHGRL